MVKTLREAEREPVHQVANRHGIGDQTIYLSRKHFRRLEPAEVKRRRALAVLQVPRIRPRRRVIDVLSKLVSGHGTPKDLRSDNGPEFVSRAILRWLSSAQIDMAHIDAGKPWQNGSNASFNDKFSDECLSMEWFTSRIDAKIVIENRRRHYNAVRPHSSLGNQTPLEFKQQISQQRPE